MDEKSSQTPPLEQRSDSPLQTSPSQNAALTPPLDADFMPPKAPKPSKMRYLWLVLLLLLVLSVVGVGAYIIDADNRTNPPEISALTTPTPDMPNVSKIPSPLPTDQASDSADVATPSAKPTVKISTSSGSLR